MCVWGVLYAVVCGRGDMRTAKGKRTRQSYGNSRPRNKSKGRGLPVTPLPQSGIKKNVEPKSSEEVALELDETLLTT
ncbi:hypothetical protein O6H91_18G069700 [Diphasiastrum complanatum]|uniref:Uncharacterized protein n=1 Tax=Diphasiastrum complanatum TaxID=34168 RepID=A0ACC2B2D6_DIPCM|nr:hypothetical protein O6H91_18G069700 [Diphasiastrum complanatum]